MKRKTTLSDEFLARVNGPWKSKERMSFFLGMACMALADDVVTEDEAKALQRQLAYVQTDGYDDPIMSKALVLLDQCLVSGSLTPEGAEKLKHELEQIIVPIQHLGGMQETIKLPVKEPEPLIEFSGSEFVFTGKFSDLGGMKKELYFAELLQELGGTVHDGNVRRNTDYVVLAKYASNSYSQSNYGNKIKQALALEAKTGKPICVSEGHFRASLKLALDIA
jgi:NAD-dependent DNA ligase